MVWTINYLDYKSSYQWPPSCKFYWFLLCTIFLSILAVLLWPLNIGTLPSCQITPLLSSLFFSLLSPLLSLLLSSCLTSPPSSGPFFLAFLSTWEALPLYLLMALLPHFIQVSSPLINVAFSPFPYTTSFFFLALITTLNCTGFVYIYFLSPPL